MHQPLNTHLTRIILNYKKIDDYSKLRNSSQVSIQTVRDLTSETNLLIEDMSDYFKKIKDELKNKSSKIASLVENRETFLGPFTINFYYLLYLFPAGMGTISFILIFRFKDLLSFQKVLKNNYEDEDMGLIYNSSKYIKLRTPSLFDGESRINFYIVVSIPIAIFLVSCIINIDLLLLLSSVQRSLLDVFISIISMIVGLIMIIISFTYARNEYTTKYDNKKYEY